MPRVVQKQRTEEVGKFASELKDLNRSRVQQSEMEEEEVRRAERNERRLACLGARVGLTGIVMGVLNAVFIGDNGVLDIKRKGQAPSLFRAIAKYMQDCLRDNFDWESFRDRATYEDDKAVLIGKLATAMYHGTDRGRWFCGPICDGNPVKSFLYNVFSQRHKFFSPYVVIDPSELKVKVEEAVRCSAAGIIPQKLDDYSTSQQAAGTSASAIAANMV